MYLRGAARCVWFNIMPMAPSALFLKTFLYTNCHFNKCVFIVSNVTEDVQQNVYKIYAPVWYCLILNTVYTHSCYL